MKTSTMFVVGAGTMGTGIAQVGLEAGHAVTLCDTSPEQLRRARAELEGDFDRLTAKGRMTEEWRQDCLGRADYTVDLSQAAEADLVIEAVAEDLAVKRAVMEELGRICRADALLASNTSTISITAIAAKVERPERVLGMHFFNPVPKMKLLELVQGLLTSEETMVWAREIGDLLGKVCITAQDSGGFIANRIGSPMLNAAPSCWIKEWAAGRTSMRP